MRIIKSGGHCYEGTGLISCDFWVHGKDSFDGQSRCTLFGQVGVVKDASESLRCCDHIYGIHYEGRP